MTGIRKNEQVILSSEGLVNSITPLGLLSPSRRYPLIQQALECAQERPLQPISFLLSLVYEVAAENVRRWERAYLKISTLVNHTAPGNAAASAPAANVRQTLDDIVANIQSALGQHYSLSAIPVGGARESLWADDASQPFHALRYTSLPAQLSWLSPAHMQPILDEMWKQSGASRITLHLTWLPASATNGAGRYFLAITTQGLAITSPAHSALIREFCGWGVLVNDPAPIHARPTAELVPVTSAVERAIFSEGFVYGPSCKVSTGISSGLTSMEAAFLFATPMALLSVHPPVGAE